MNLSKILSPLLISTLIILTVSQFAPNFLVPDVPKANAVVGGGNKPILGLYSELRKTNAVFDTTVNSGQTFTMDVNVTDVIPLKAFDINITFTPSITFSSSFFKTATGCPQCLLANLTTFIPTGGYQTGNGFYRLFVIDQDGGTPFFGGTGILFRITFKATGAAVASNIHIKTTSTLQNPSPVPYQTIDGYFSNKGSAAIDYRFGV